MSRTVLGWAGPVGRDAGQRMVHVEVPPLAVVLVGRFWTHRKPLFHPQMPSLPVATQLAAMMVGATVDMRVLGAARTGLHAVRGLAAAGRTTGVVACRRIDRRTAGRAVERGALAPDRRAALPAVVTGCPGRGRPGRSRLTGYGHDVTPLGEGLTDFWAVSDGLCKGCGLLIAS